MFVNHYLIGKLNKKGYILRENVISIVTSFPKISSTNI